MLTAFVLSFFLTNVCVNSQQYIRPESVQYWYPNAAKKPTNSYSPYVNYYSQQNPQSNYYPNYYPVTYQQPSYKPSNVQTGQPLYYYPSINQNQRPMYYPSVNIQTPQLAYPSNYVYPNLQQPIQGNQLRQNASKPTNAQPEPQRQYPYANVPTEFIDVEPEHFNRLMQMLHLRPQIVSVETRVRHAKRRRPHYKVIKNVKHSNHSYIPELVNTTKVFNKVYSFNKTFVLHPNENKKEVINLNFVNGEQVDEQPAKVDEEKEEGEEEGEEEDEKEDESDERKVTTTEPVTTTTESDEPDDVDGWF